MLFTGYDIKYYTLCYRILILYSKIEGRTPPIFAVIFKWTVYYTFLNELQNKDLVILTKATLHKSHNKITFCYLHY